MKKFSFNFNKLIKFLNPSPPIGGLEIGDSFMRFFRLNRNDTILNQSLQLPPGIVEGGIVKNKKNLVAALKQLRQQLEQKTGSNFFQFGLNKTIPIILTINANNVYTQIFSLPYLALQKLDEAAKLNLQMISPIDIKSVYADWQMVGEANVGSQLELLGAFVRSDLVEGYSSALREVNFSLVALEFIPLSLARAIKEWSQGLDLERPLMVLLVGNEGLDFIILKGGNLYFNRFIHWQDDIKSLLTSEIQKVINFYYGKWGELINNLVLVAPNPIAEVEESLKGLNINIQPLTLKTNMLPAWLAVMGAALRGAMPRSEDNLISLTSLGTEEDYYRNRLFYFIGIWRNTLISVFGLIFVSSLLVNWFLLSLNNSLAERLNFDSNDSFSKNLTGLQEKAKIFNLLVAQAEKGKQQSLKWSWVLNQLLTMLGPNISLTRFHFDPSTQTALVGGYGVSEIEIINFKNRLVRNSNFESISLPLSQIVRDGDRISFQLSLRVKTSKT